MPKHWGGNRHMEAVVLNLTEGKMTGYDLPRPLLVYHNTYYYNKKYAKDKYVLTARDMITGDERKVLNCIGENVNVIGNKLLIRSAFTMNSTMGEDVPQYDKNSCTEYCIDLKSGKVQEIQDKNDEDGFIDILAEYNDDYIINYTLTSDLAHPRLGYISKKDYYNGKLGIQFVD